MGTGEFNAGGNTAMDWHLIREGVGVGGIIYFQSFCDTETGISSILIGH